MDISSFLDSTFQKPLPSVMALNSQPQLQLWQTSWGKAIFNPGFHRRGWMPFPGAEQDPGSKQARLYQVRAKVHPIPRHIPGSRQQTMAREEQRTRANTLWPCCCCPTSQWSAAKALLLLLPSQPSLRHHCFWAMDANSVLSEQAQGEGSLSVF